jgi:hypothetical protein
MCLIATALVACRKKSALTPDPSLSGRATDVVSGAAIAGVMVAIQGKTATTGSDGRYSIAGLMAGQAPLTGQHQGHKNFTQNVTISGATVTDIPMTPSNTAKAAGAWRGNVAGAADSNASTMTVSVDTIAKAVQIVVDFRGSREPGPATLIGPYGSATARSITMKSAVLGDVALQWTPTGQVSGSCTNSPDPDIKRVDFTGTVTPTSITVNYTTSWADGTFDNGTLTFTKQS